MKLPEGVRRLFRLPLARSRVARDIDEEIQFHIAEKTDAFIAVGLSPSEARAKALRALGEPRAVRTELLRIDDADVGRAVRRQRWADWWMDLGHALRSLARAPGLTATVIVMLGLGIGGAAAMYGLLDRLLLRVGPDIAEPNRLRRLYLNTYQSWSHERVYRVSFTAAMVRGVRAAWGKTAQLAALATWEAPLDPPSGERIPIVLISGDAFTTLGVRPYAGRLLQPQDDAAGAPAAAVISYELWRRHFGADAHVLGRTLALGPIRYTIVGIAPPGFSGLRPDRVDAWVPMSLGGAAYWGPRWEEFQGVFEVIVRPRPGASLPALTGAATAAYQESISAPFPRDTTAYVLLRSVSPAARPGPVSDTMRLSLIVAAVAAALCLIAIANGANLMLLRAVRRRRETAVRIALGIGRLRLARGLILESLLLGLAGAAAALLIGSWIAALLQKVIVQREWQAGVMNVRVVVFAALAGGVIGVLLGIVPAWQASGQQAIAALKSGTRSGSGKSRLRASLLGFQAALAVVLLAGLGLFVRSLSRADAVDYGVPPDRLVSVDIGRAAGRGGVPAGATETLAKRLRLLPGVRALARATVAPIYGFSGVPGLRIEGVDTVVMDQHGPFFTQIDTAFVEVTGLPLLRGRSFTGDEVAASAPVALVNDAFARRFWPKGGAIGKCLYARSEPVGPQVCRQIVGVVGNHRSRLEDDAPPQNIYVPLGRLFSSAEPTLILRTSGPASVVAAAAGRLVRQRFPDADPNAIMALSEITDRELDPWRNGVRLFGLFAGLAVLLAAGGLYAVVAFSVAQRRPELAIRVAVGARTRHLVRLVLGQALRPVAVGLTVGAAVTMWLVQFVAPLLYQTRPRDPVVLAAAIAGMLACAALAAISPALAAARTDAREALQAE